MRLGIAQIGAGTDPQLNLQTVRDATMRLRRRGAELVVFPEYTMYEKKKVDSTFGAVAEPLDGAFASGLAAIAAEAGVALVAGVVERSGTDLPHNTILAIDRTGERLAHYRKLHLFDSYGFRESDSIAPGDNLEPVTFPVGTLTVGMMTCYDLRFPEQAREIADAGAELLLVCSSWVPGPGKVEQWRTLARARAIENEFFVAAVSQTPPVSIGNSLVIDPGGGILDELDDRPAEAVVDIDPAHVRAAREQDPVLDRRRYSIRRGAPAVSRPEPR